MEIDTLLAQLKAQVIEHLNLQAAPDFDADTLLFSPEGLGLDSIDALELVVLLDRDYGISKIDPEHGKEIFRTLRTLGQFILAQGQVN